MFNFFSTFKTDVRKAISDIHDRFVTLETKIEALMSHAKEASVPNSGAVEAASAPPATSDTAVTTSTETTPETK